MAIGQANTITWLPRVATQEPTEYFERVLLTHPAAFSLTCCLLDHRYKWFAYLQICHIQTFQLALGARSFNWGKTREAAGDFSRNGKLRTKASLLKATTNKLFRKTFIRFVYGMTDVYAEMTYNAASVEGIGETRPKIERHRYMTSLQYLLLRQHHLSILLKSPKVSKKFFNLSLTMVLYSRTKWGPQTVKHNWRHLKTLSCI